MALHESAFAPHLAYMYIYIYIYIYTYIHTYICTHTHRSTTYTCTYTHYSHIALHESALAQRPVGTPAACVCVFMYVFMYFYVFRYECVCPGVQNVSCMYVFMYIHTYVYVFHFIYIYIYICILVRICVCICIWGHIFACRFECFILSSFMTCSMVQSTVATHTDIDLFISPFQAWLPVSLQCHTCRRGESPSTVCCACPCWW
jgi:hypothetical protein